MSSSQDLHQDAEAAQARVARLGHERTALALAGIAAMIAALEADGRAADPWTPSTLPGARPAG